MKRYRGGESAPRGVYLNLSTWEVIQLYGEVLTLPGNGEVQYLKAPAPLVVALGPFAGLAFIIFLPLIGIVGVAGLLAYKVGRGAWALGRRALQPAAIGWKPGEAHLIRRGRTPKEEQSTEGTEVGLPELEQEIAKRREQGKE